MIIPFRQANGVAGLSVGDELCLGIVALGHIDRNLRFCRRDRGVAEHADDAQRAGVEDQPFAPASGVDRDALCRAGKAKRGMHDEVAVAQRQRRRRIEGFGDERMRSVEFRFFVEDAPAQTAAQRLRIRRAENGREMQNVALRRFGFGRLLPRGQMQGRQGRVGTGRIRGIRRRGRWIGRRRDWQAQD